MDLACNYEPTANVDDNSCEFGTCPGCTDPAAANYNPTSTNDEACVYCETDNLVTVSAELSGGESEVVNFQRFSSISGCSVSISFNGASSSYPADILVELVSDDGSCVVWGGWDITSTGNANDCTNLGTGNGGVWPSNWNSTTNGFYTATVNFPESFGSASICAEYQLIVTNGFSNSGTCNYEMEFDFE